MGMDALLLMCVLTFRRRILWLIVREPLVVATISLCNQRDRHRAERQAQYLPMLYSAATKLMLTKMCPIFAGICPFYVRRNTLTRFQPNPTSIMLSRQWQIQMRLFTFCEVIITLCCYHYLCCKYFFPFFLSLFPQCHIRGNVVFFRSFRLAIDMIGPAAKNKFHKARDKSKQLSIIIGHNTIKIISC